MRRIAVVCVRVDRPPPKSKQTGAICCGKRSVETQMAVKCPPTIQPIGTFSLVCRSRFSLRVLEGRIPQAIVGFANVGELFVASGRGWSSKVVCWLST